MFNPSLGTQLMVDSTTTSQIPWLVEPLVIEAGFHFKKCSYSLLAWCMKRAGTNKMAIVILAVHAMTQKKVCKTTDNGY